MFDANQLALAAQENLNDSKASPRTVHHYVTEKILPPAAGRGPNAYTMQHMELFLMARQLRLEGQSLEDIKAKTQALWMEDSASIANSYNSTPLSKTSSEVSLAAPASADLTFGSISVPSVHLNSEDSAFLGGITATRSKWDRIASKSLMRASKPLGHSNSTPESNAYYASGMNYARSSGKMPRSLRFRGGFSLQCPADADDELIAEIYESIEGILNTQISPPDSSGAGESIQQ